MDNLVIVAFILSTLAISMVMMLAPVVGYILWRYVIQPWKVMRTDLAALAGRVSAVENQARVHSLNDAEVARIEARMNARERARMEQR